MKFRLTVGIGVKRPADHIMPSKWYSEIEAHLSHVSKPSRYLGNEVNAVHKDLRQVKLKIALAFPDAYQIGMSHLGFRIMYDLLNRRPDTAAERFFCPWPDMEKLMRQRGVPLLSQESRTPLFEFDVIGFSIPYEMGYSNILNMLELGKIPLEAGVRSSTFPLLIAGGPCTVNPEPLAHFFDAFLVGDGEEVSEQILDVVLHAKGEGWPKEQLLEHLSRLSGIYIPSFFRVKTKADESLSSMNSTLAGYERVVRHIAPDLDVLDYPTDGIVPFARPVHDRLNLEIARGCTKGCRFCQAGFTYRPVRERSPSKIMELAETSLRSTGYEGLSLLSLSSGDYTCISHLMRDLILRYAPEKVAISFPSLRIGSLSDELMGLIKEVRKTGITLAPEAGSERLRRVINKDVGEEEILDTARLVFEKGWLSLKLYFMIGLPTENYEDLEGIVTLCESISKGIRSKRARKKLIVSLSTFVPKPHTPFQWASQLSFVETKARLDFIRRKLRRRDIHVKWQHPHLSLLEGAFARGDRRLARVLMKAHELGCRFDGWSEQFRFDRWEKAFGDCGIPLEEYVTRPMSPDERLPWDHIDVGVSREFLLEEYQKAIDGRRTQDCRQGQCQSCGVCDHHRISVVLADPSAALPPFPGMRTFQGPYHRSRGREIRRKFRVQYTKQGSARFLSHLELQDTFIRAMRRGNIPLQFSEGFHPLPRIDLGPALPVGVESMEEYFDFESFGHLDGPEILRVMKQMFPDGVEPVACEEIPIEAPSLFGIPNRSHYRIEIPEGIGPTGKALQERVDQFSHAPTLMVRRFRKDKVLEVDIKDQVLGLALDLPQTLDLQVYFGPEGSVRVMDIVGAILDMDTSQVRTLRIVKTSVEFLQSPVKTALSETAP